MTGNLAEDPPEWSQAGHITTKPQRDAIKARMKDMDDPLKIVIVRDMWLTGTDIPCLHTLYVDKPMKGHSLIQAIARVNRIFRDKPGGLIVDFIGIGEELKEAAKKYTQGGGTWRSGSGHQRRSKRGFFAGAGERARFGAGASSRQELWRLAIAANIEFEDLFVRCCGHLTETDELRDEFLVAEARLNSAFSLINHLSIALATRMKWCSIRLLRKQLLKTTSGPNAARTRTGPKAVRELLDRSIESKGVVDIFADGRHRESRTSQFWMNLFSKSSNHTKQENLRIKLLAKIVADEIRSARKERI